MTATSAIDLDVFRPTKHPDSKVHLLPCKINHEGPANMEYFIESAGENNCSTTTIRGRKLIGKELELPQDYKLSIISQQIQSWVVTGKPSSLTVWEHCDEPDGYNCAAMNINDWVRLNDSLHCEIPID